MPLLSCPDCEREVSDRALACPNCGYPFGAQAAAGAAAPPLPARSSLQEIAYRQKLLLYALLIRLLSVIPILALMSAGALALLGVLFFLLRIAFEFWCFVRFCRAVGMALPVIVPVMMLLLVPFVGLLVLLIVNRRGTRALQEAGVRVGLMGASLDEVP